MGATLLQAEAVERPWGRRSLPPGFETFERDEPVGEIRHEPRDGDASALLVKHLFSAERLSIQVHPDDVAAATFGLPRGKDEAWLILAAEPGATLGLGLTRPASREEVEAAALSGAIERMVEWRRVKAGDFVFSPAGTIHAIGGGLSLIEIQQNSDVTYRLYDYGRLRELHLERALAVADLRPWQDIQKTKQVSEGRKILLSDAAFVVEEWIVRGMCRIAPSEPLLVTPRSGSGWIDGSAISVGQVWSALHDIELRADEAMTLLVTYPGREIMSGLDL